MSLSKVVPVILCGGSGSRLWPLSRTDTPKQFLKLLDNDTLLQKTARRALGVLGADPGDIVVVTLDAMKEETRKQLTEISPHAGNHVLGEPEARNTAAAVAYAAMYVRKNFGEDAMVWILPADHYIGDEEMLSIALDEAIRIARRDYLAIFGIEPTRPETGYGYIRKSQKIESSESYHVDAFVEKPDLATAQKFMAAGTYLWNSGMHVFTLRAVEAAYRKFAPDVWEAVGAALPANGSGRAPTQDGYARARQAPFESAVLERADAIAVVPCDPLWSDIGSWDSLWEINPKNKDGNAMNGRVVCEETENSFIIAQNRLVTCIGMKDIVVIETHDSVLVADRRCNGSMKKLLATLQKNGHTEMLSSPKIPSPSLRIAI